MHYKEYLGDLIWKNDIDPIVIFNEDELELVLKRENIRLPLKSNKEDYKQILIDVRTTYFKYYFNYNCFPLIADNRTTIAY